MDNNEIQRITPLTNNTNSQQTNNIETLNPINNIQPSITDTQIINDDFAHGLPSWDLVPPYATVRRVNRK